jgi:SAM-dependent methyltransferase
MTDDPEMASPDTNAAPMPCDELRERVTGSRNAEWFHASGQQTLGNIRGALAKIDRELEDYDSILDFGCGSGRLLRWLRPLASTRSIHGCDVDAEAIEWLRSALPEIQLQVNRPLPALEAPSGSYDLVLCHSVFTHLDEEYQDAWLQELRRVLRPGGHLVVSFSGDHVFAEREREAREHGTNPAPFREHLERHGILFLRDDDLPFDDFYQATYHAPWYVYRHWSRYFRIRTHIERGALDFQDLVVLEREGRAEQPGHRGDSPGVTRTKRVMRHVPGAKRARRALQRLVR